MCIRDRPGRVVQNAVGHNSAVLSEKMTVSFCHYSAESGPMEPCLLYTSVIDFTAAVKVDALAVGIGNAHGLYKGRPNLAFQRLQAVLSLIHI